MSRKKNSRQWARLRILCSGGLHLLTLVPDAFDLVGELIANSESQLFLLADGGPAQHPSDPDLNFSGVLPPPNGYFHSDAAQFGRAPCCPCCGPPYRACDLRAAIAAASW
jgi:hypothetical protein